MPALLSGVDAIAPAIEQTKRQLFKPFRFGRWARLAVVSFLTGELTGSGGWSGATNLNFPSGGGKSGKTTDLLAFANPLGERVMEYLPWILTGATLLFVLALLWIYVSSVFRFILLEAVLYDRCKLREGWRRWQTEGGSYFLWTIGFGLASLAGMSALVGGPLLIAWQAGIFRHPDQHLVLLIVGGVILFFLFIALTLAIMLCGFFAKDFVVPVMAMENVGVLEGWRRLFPMMGAEKTAYLVYVVMKIVLALGSAILFGIIDVIVLLILLIPLGILGFIVVLLASAAGLSWNPATIAVAVVVGAGVLLALFFVMAFISAPATVFFQSYTLHFFGSRYPRLGEQLFPSNPLSSGPPPSVAALP